MHLKVSTNIDSQKCVGCGACVKVCPYRVISLVNKKAIITGCESLNCGHCAAACPTEAIRVTTLRKPAFKTFSMEESWLGFGKGDTPELARLMASLRSCRNFSDKPVAKEIIEDLVNVGTLAPSGSNQQEWSFTILHDRAQVKALAKHTAEFIRWANRLASITPLRKLLSLVGYKEGQQYYDRYVQEFTRCLAEWDGSGRDFVYHHAPCAILIGIPRVIGTPVEDAMLAAHNIRLAAHTMGLGSCLIGISVRAMKAQPSIIRKMGLPLNEEIHAAIAIGWPSADERYARTIERRRIAPRYLKAG